MRRRKNLFEGLFIFLAAVILIFGLALSAQALQFQFGTFDLDTYTDWYGISYGNINVVNTTGNSGSLPVPVDITSGELRFSLASDDSGTDATNYHLILNEPNYVFPFGVKDSLTGLNYTDYNSNNNTYTDGEVVSSIGSGDSLINLVNTWYTQTILDTSLYIKNLKFTGQVQLSNFTFTDNANTYVYNGLVDLSAENFIGNWYSIASNMSQPGSSVAITGDVPENQPPAPIPLPSTLALVGLGLLVILCKARAAGFNLQS